MGNFPDTGTLQMKHQDAHPLIFRQCITSVDYAQNMIVVKTMPGLANGAASAIDKLNIPEMLGTLAGDDTCFVVLKDTQAAAELCAEIREQIEH